MALLLPGVCQQVTTRSRAAGMALVHWPWAGTLWLWPFPQGPEQGQGRAVELWQALQVRTAMWAGVGTLAQYF